MTEISVKSPSLEKNQAPKKDERIASDKNTLAILLPNKRYESSQTFDITRP